MMPINPFKKHTVAGGGGGDLSESDNTGNISKLDMSYITNNPEEGND